MVTRRGTAETVPRSYFSTAPIQLARKRIRLPLKGLIEICDSCLRQDFLLLGKDGVLTCLGNPHLDHFLSRDLDRLASGGVSAHAGFALNKNEFADARKDEDTHFLRL
jgi:hypothetical protein